METARSPYKTRQQELLLSYLKSTRGRHFTVEDVRTHFSNKHIAIGVATIYRHLERLAASGAVNKYIIDENSAACFEYMGGGSCSADKQHFHLKCGVCGTLIHLKCEELALIQNHLLNAHGFVLNPFRTVFYGTCAGCAQAPRRKRACVRRNTGL
ncbi:MAG: transcriptional repressor [Treponema sp.]|nr:transcriptional repressor [Treponema sp.]